MRGARPPVSLSKDATCANACYRRIPVQNSLPLIRTGADFWRVSSVASGFSGDAGRRRLSLLIQSRLPSPAESIQL